MTSFPRQVKLNHELGRVSEVLKLFRKHRQSVLRNAFGRGRQLYLLIQKNAQIEILSDTVPCFFFAVHST